MGEGEFCARHVKLCTVAGGIRDLVPGYDMADAGVVMRTVRGRIEPRSAREHRRLEKLFRSAQEARNALIEDSRSARAWNLLQIRRHRRTNAAWEPKAADFFDWQGKTGERKAGEAGAVFVAGGTKQDGDTAAGCWEDAAGVGLHGFAGAGGGVPHGGRRLQGWPEVVAVSRLAGAALGGVGQSSGNEVGGRQSCARQADGQGYGKLAVPSLRAASGGCRDPGGEHRADGARRAGRGAVGLRGVHLLVQEHAVKQQEAELTRVVGVDAGGRATATDDCGGNDVAGRGT